MSIRLSLLAAVAASTLACAPTVGVDSEAPPLVVDTGPLPKVVSSIVADDQNVFWTGARDGDSFVAQRPVAGGAVTILASAHDPGGDPFTHGPRNVIGVWINHTEVFWMRDEHRIEACPIGGGPARVVADPVSDEAFVVDDENAYMIRDDESGLSSVSLTTGEEKLLCASCSNVALADDDALLVSDGRSLERFARDGGSLEQLAELGPFDTAGTASSAIVASFGSATSYCEDGLVACYELLVGDASFEHSRNFGDVPNFALDEEAVYIGTEGAIVRTPLDGGAVTRIPGGSVGAELGLNRDFVFWQSTSERDPTSPTFIEQAPIR